MALVEELHRVRRVDAEAAEVELDGVIEAISQSAARGRELAAGSRVASDEAAEALERVERLRRDEIPRIESAGWLPD
jgi:ABC-type transporter Mla subunit MlaD